MKYILFLLLPFLVDACINPATQINNKALSTDSTDSELDQLILPTGLQINYYAKNIKNARSITKSPSGVLYVGTRNAGNVYAVVDKNKDYIADTIITLLSGLNMPNGVSYHKGDLYIAEIDKIHRIKDIDSQIYTKNLKTEIIFDELPDDTHHGWKYIAMGPDNMIYIPVGAPCNVCDSEDEIYASIGKLNLETLEYTTIAHGVRNTVGFDWDPETKDLWFSDNGRDWMGDDLPPCELNHLTSEGQHFGFPYCHGQNHLDDKYGKNKDCDDYKKPAMDLGPHVAPLGIEFLEENVLDSMQGQGVLIAEHGSWNRSTPIGYRITRVDIKNGEAQSYRNYISGWLQKDTTWGRPVDLEWLDDGSLLISDDYNDAIYRVSTKNSK